MPENTGPQDAHPDYPRLPCRGCTADCSDYLLCEGKPWRMTKHDIATPLQQEATVTD